MTGVVIRIGTRPSALAMAQAGQVAERLRAAGHACELVPISTVGDRSGAPVVELGVGVFVSAVRDALAAGEVDVAVHSAKDLPTAPDPRLVLAAVPLREDPRDALVARDGLVLGELPPGSRVGTGSPRRAAQLEALGLGLVVVPIRGNVDTRVRRVHDGDLDGVVVAAAGLRRLGRIAEASELLDPVVMLPAPAQGALAIECRAATGGPDAAGFDAGGPDTALRAVLAAVLDDPGSRAAAAAERAVLATLEGGCRAPVGALADVVSDWASGDGDAREGDPGDGDPGDGDPGGGDTGGLVERLSLRAVVGTADGGLVRASATGDIDDAEKLGAALAAELLDLMGSTER